MLTAQDELAQKSDRRKKSMTNGTCFIQDCPTCGRTLRIRVEYMGRQLTCQHCRGKLTAKAEEDAANVSDSLALLQRADALLNQTRIA